MPEMDYARRAAQQEKEKRQKEEKQKRAAKSTGQHTTEPIRDHQMVLQWLRIAEEHDKKRAKGGVSWYLLLLLGFNTGLRISDICDLKVSDVRDRERIRIIANKTGKESNIKLQAPVQKRLNEILRARGGGEFILQSRQKGVKTGTARPISRQRAFLIVKKIAKTAGFQGHVGCHTLRKTFAFELYMTTGDLSLVQKVLNHSSQMETLRYIGLDQMAVDKAIDDMPKKI